MKISILSCESFILDCFDDMFQSVSQLESTSNPVWMEHCERHGETEKHGVSLATTCKLYTSHENSFYANQHKVSEKSQLNQNITL